MADCPQSCLIAFNPFWSQGDFVWLKSSVGVPIGAEVTVTDTGQLRLVDDDGKVRILSSRDVLCLFFYRWDPNLTVTFVFNAGAQDHQEDGGGGPAHAPHLGQQRGGHDPAGWPERGGAPQEPAGATQGGPHLRRCHRWSTPESSFYELRIAHKVELLSGLFGLRPSLQHRDWSCETLPRCFITQSFVSLETEPASVDRESVGSQCFSAQTLRTVHSIINRTFLFLCCKAVWGKKRPAVFEQHLIDGFLVNTD